MAGSDSPSISLYDDDEGGMIVGINVTPLVDITLVLLIIFMVTTSYIVQPALKVELPKAATAEAAVKTTLSLELGPTGALSLNGHAASEGEVRAFIGQTLPRKPDLQAVIAADKAVSHGAVVHLIDLVRQAGVHRFALSVDAAVEKAADEPPRPSAEQPARQPVDPPVEQLPPK